MSRPGPIERILCNTCRAWSRLPYRRGRCARCTGVQVGGIRACCGDCDRSPCECTPPPVDYDVAWLGHREGGLVIAQRKAERAA